MINPKVAKEKCCNTSSKILNTIFSPSTVGNTDTRNDTFSPPSLLNIIRPSWGNLVSSNFKLAKILILATKAGCSSRGKFNTSCNTPSILYLTTTSLANGSICTSDASSITANSKIVSIAFTTDTSLAKSAIDTSPLVLTTVFSASSANSFFKVSLYALKAS